MRGFGAAHIGENPWHFVPTVWCRGNNILRHADTQANTAINAAAYTAGDPCNIKQQSDRMIKVDL